VGGGGIQDRGGGPGEAVSRSVSVARRAGSGWGGGGRGAGVLGCWGSEKAFLGLWVFGLGDWVVVAVAEEGGVYFLLVMGFWDGVGCGLWGGMRAVGVFVLGGGVGGDGVGCWRSGV